jgi:hypothetical protein
MVIALLGRVKLLFLRLDTGKDVLVVIISGKSEVLLDLKDKIQG